MNLTAQVLVIKFPFEKIFSCFYLFCFRSVSKKCSWMHNRVGLYVFLFFRFLSASTTLYFICKSRSRNFVLYTTSSSVHIHIFSTSNVFSLPPTHCLCTALSINLLRVSNLSTVLYFPCLWMWSVSLSVSLYTTLYFCVPILQRFYIFYITQYFLCR